MIKASEVRDQELRSFDDRAFDLLGELLIQRETEKLLLEIESDKANGNTAEMDAFFSRHDQKNLERIDRYFRRQKSRRFLTKTLPKVGQTAAIFIATIALAGSIAIATNHTIRVRVMELLVNIEEEYTELQLREDPEASFDVPAEWKGENYPSFIPEGMEFVTVHSNVNASYVDYSHPDFPTLKFIFSEHGENSEANIDSESAEITPITIRGKPGFIAKKDDKIIIYWDNGRKYFILTADNLGESTVLRIAKSVLRVD